MAEMAAADSRPLHTTETEAVGFHPPPACVDLPGLTLLLRADRLQGS
jgi:hypothetical protein